MDGAKVYVTNGNEKLMCGEIHTPENKYQIRSLADRTHWISCRGQTGAGIKIEVEPVMSKTVISLALYEVKVFTEPGQFHIVT